MAKETNQTDLKALKGPDQVRLRPAVIFGSDSIEGCRHSVFEIISNSIDEAREGFGKRINITLHADKSITVEDFGRGIPIDFNKSEDKYNWELAFCTLYAGKVRQQQRRKLLVRARTERSGLVRDAVRLRVYGGREPKRNLEVFAPL